MKLVAATAAAMAIATKAQNEMMPMEEMVDAMEEPWWAWMQDYGLVMEEDKMTFEMKDPKIFIERYHDGSSVIIKSPWYKEKFTMSEKDTAWEMNFKNEMPGWEVVNKMNMKMAQYNKNDKVADPNCTNSNPKKCLIKTPVGLQNKRQFEGEHSNSQGKFKVWEYNNYVHDMEMKPTEVHFRQGYDFSHHANGEMALGMTMEDGDMAEANNSPWFTKGQTKMDAEMKYKKYTDPASLETMDHWDSTVWSFSHSTDDSEMGEKVVAAEGSSNVESLTYDMEANTAEMKVNYDSSCNMGWSDSGVNTQKWENTDSCMEHMQMAMEGRWEEFFMADFGDKPCVWVSEVEGTHVNNGEEMDYTMGMALEFRAFNNHRAYYKNSMEEVPVTSWAPLAEVKTEEVEGMMETTFNHMGQDIMTVNFDKVKAHHMEVSDKMHRMGFEMYKHKEFAESEWAKMDWTNEEDLKNYFATIINWDYPMQQMSDMEQAAVKAFQEMECNYPHWDEMAENGITVHEAAKEMIYAMKSQMLQEMQLGLDVDYFRLSHLSWYFYSVDGSMSTKDIMMQLWSMDYADQYDWVADMLEEKKIEVYVNDLMFIYKYLDMEPPMGFAPVSIEEETAIREQFEAELPDVAQLRAYAQQIRDFVPVEMAWNEIDLAANDMCNMHFDMLLKGHKQWNDMHISYVVEHREMTQEWVGKYNQWINTPRAEVEANFDEFQNRFDAIKESAIYECEYQYWAAPMRSGMFVDQTEECQAMLLEKYPEIQQWEADKMMENEIEMM
jgi:hypothetical protein